jgi:hypothetical protein
MIMKYCLIIFLLLTVSVSRAQYNQVNLSLDEAATVSAHQYLNLKLYPIRAKDSFFKAHKDVGRYTTLEQALKNEGIVISETGTSSNSGTVNELYIQNVSADTIMILSGEVVQGGKQDRMIALDVILYPGKNKRKVQVYCVEHGRWQPNGDGRNFKNYYSLSSNEVRKAGTVAKNQQEVWDKVADATSKNDAKSNTGTLAALKSSESFSTDLKKYADHFQKTLINEPDVIGFVAVSGDRILGCDMFATHALFADHYAGLINSYATEAITSGKPATVKQEDVNRYLLSIIADEQKQDSEINKKGTQLKDKNQKLHISTF